MSKIIEPRLYRLEDAALAYGFSERQLRRWVAEGRIGRVKISGPSGPTWFERAELDRLVAESTIAAGAKTGRAAPRRKSIKH